MKQIIFALVVFILVGCQPVEKTPEHSMEQMQHMSMKMHAGTESSIEVMNGVTVTFERPKAETGKEVPLKFILTKEGKPMTDLQIMHDKLMHVVLVRKGLKHFDHVHPAQTTPGTFVVPYTFSAAGEYRVWADFTFENMQHIIDFDMSATGKQEAQEKDKLYGLKVEMEKPELEQGKQAQFSFTITDETGKTVPITEKFLAADGHLIVIDETLGEFEHAHDETGDKDNVLSFEYTPEKAGKHKAWAQFKIEGKDRAEEFEFSVP